MQGKRASVSSLRPGFSSRFAFGARLFATVAVASLSGACSPYPDDGEFLAGVVYAQNFIAGTKAIDRLGAVGNGRGNWPQMPYTVFLTTRSADTQAEVGTTNRDGALITATTPFWTDSKKKRDPLLVSNAGRVYVFDGPCAKSSDTEFDERLDLIRWDRQYPLFEDIPEVLSTAGGKPGRKQNYSAVVEVIHLSGPSDMPCQSIKRFDTATGRIGKDLTEKEHEYRLLQIVDPALTPSTAPPAPLPVQLGFYNQLVVPYIDMGKVPDDDNADMSKRRFKTMPLWKVYKEAAPTEKNTPMQVVIPGVSGEVSTYSPICQIYALNGQSAPPPPDLKDPVYKPAQNAPLELASCLPCRTITVDAKNVALEVECPISQSPGAEK